jgi:hypothetical protein
MNFGKVNKYRVNRYQKSTIVSFTKVGLTKKVCFLDWSTPYITLFDQHYNVNDDIKEEIGLQSKDDGEFWMSYRDFCKQFQEVTICLTGPDFDGDGF